MLTLTAVQANLQVTEDSSFKVFCSRGMQSARENVFPDQERKQQGLHVNLGLGTTSRKDMTDSLAVTRQISHGAHPVSHLEARSAEDGVDEGPTEDGCGSSDLRVSVINVVQDV